MPEILDVIPDGKARNFVLELRAGRFHGFAVRQGDRVHGYVDRCPHQGFPLTPELDAYLTARGDRGVDLREAADRQHPRLQLADIHLLDDVGLAALGAPGIDDESHLIAGGPAPLIATALYAHYQTGYAISVYIAACAVVSLVSAAFMPDYTGRDISMEYDD